MSMAAAGLLPELALEMIVAFLVSGGCSHCTHCRVAWLRVNRHTWHQVPLHQKVWPCCVTPSNPEVISWIHCAPGSKAPLMKFYWSQDRIALCTAHVPYLVGPACAGYARHVQHIEKGLRRILGLDNDLHIGVGVHGGLRSPIVAVHKVVKRALRASVSISFHWLHERFGIVHLRPSSFFLQHRRSLYSESFENAIPSCEACLYKLNETTGYNENCASCGRGPLCDNCLNFCEPRDMDICVFCVVPTPHDGRDTDPGTGVLRVRRFLFLGKFESGS